MDPNQKQRKNIDGSTIDPTKLPLPKNAVESNSVTLDGQELQSSKPSTGDNFSSTPLTKSVVEKPDPKQAKSPPWLRDIVGLAIFVVIVAAGAWFINSFIFRSFNVVGPSMEPTLNGGYRDTSNDRLIINLVPRTLARFRGNEWTPDRGDIVVFRNPSWRNTGPDDEYVVKRVVGLPGERVTVENCILKVYNDENPNGFNPYLDFENLADNDQEINYCVDGDGTDKIIPENDIFVVGDHRIGNYSMDSRDGDDDRASFGTVPRDKIIGRVAIRIWPLNRFTFF